MEYMQILEEKIVRAIAPYWFCCNLGF